MALAFVVGFNLTKRMYDNENAEEGWLDKKLIYAVVATVVGARLGHVFFYEWEYYSQNLGEIVQVWKGGLASHGAAIALILAMWIYAKKVTKKSVFWGLDKLVIMVALAGFFIRSGNLMNSEIIGGKSESDVAIFYKYSANTSFKNTVARSVRYMYPAYESAFVDEANIEGTNEVLEVQGFKYKKGNYRIVLKDNLLDNRLIVDRLFEVSQKGYDEAEDHYFLVNSKADVQIVDGKAVITGELAICTQNSDSGMGSHCIFIFIHYSFLGLLEEEVVRERRTDFWGVLNSSIWSSICY